MSSVEKQKHHPSQGGGGGDPMDQFYNLAISAGNDTTFLRTIIHRALSHPRVYTGFATLGSLPNVVQTLSVSKSGEAVLHTLDLFAYGTYKDYVTAQRGGGGGAAAGSEAFYLELTDAQLMKLRQLTVVTLVQKCISSSSSSSSSRNGGKSRNKGGRTSCVPYSLLQMELGLASENDPQTSSSSSSSSSTLRELEDLLMSCIYSNLISGKLDQRTQSFRVDVVSSTSGGTLGPTPCISRDVKLDEDVPKMISVLEKFQHRTVQLMNNLDQQIHVSQVTRQNDLERWKAVEEKIVSVRKKIGNNFKGGGGGNAAGLGDAEAAVWLAATMGGGDGGGLEGAADLSVLEGGTVAPTGAAAAAAAGGSGRISANTLRRQKRSRGGIGGAEQTFGRH